MRSRTWFILFLVEGAFGIWASWWGSDVEWAVGTVSSLGALIGLEIAKTREAIVAKS